VIGAWGWLRSINWRSDPTPSATVHRSQCLLLAAPENNKAINCPHPLAGQKRESHDSRVAATVLTNMKTTYRLSRIGLPPFSPGRDAGRSTGHMNRIFTIITQS